MDNKTKVVLDAAKVRNIKCISGILQSTQTFKTDGSVKSEPFDYRRYRFDGVVFNIKEEEGFFEELKAGTIWEATLYTGDEKVDVNGKEEVIKRVEFDNHVTALQQTNLVKMVGGIKRLEQTLSAPIKVVTKEELEAAMA